MMTEDKRITYATICGKDYPLCLTVAAEQKIIDTFGGLEAMANRMTEGEMGIPMTAQLAHILLEGGNKRVKALAWMEGEEADTRDVPPLEVLMDVLDLKDANELGSKLFEAIRVSRGVTVEVAEDAEEGKNGETTQE
ncbi:MAG: hypothetical protein IJ448_01480 [Oscillospiraceae bacterium]|nr:hypothetical protein [Oscillospiraceae bacterium]